MKTILSQNVRSPWTDGHLLFIPSFRVVKVTLGSKNLCQLNLQHLINELQ
jgi:hypothetical protein